MTIFCSVSSYNEEPKGEKNKNKIHSAQYDVLLRCFQVHYRDCMFLDGPRLVLRHSLVPPASS